MSTASCACTSAVYTVYAFISWTGTDLIQPGTFPEGNPVLEHPWTCAGLSSLSGLGAHV